MWEGRALFIDWAPAAASLHRKGIPGGGAALTRLLVITVVALVAASLRLRRMKVETSSAD
jgi:hypothetical protein